MSITIKAEIPQSINYAAAHIGKQILVKNLQLSDVETNQLVCRIYGAPEFFYEYKKEFAVTGGEFKVEDPDLKLNDAFYRQEMIEARDGEIKIELYHPDEPEKLLGFLNTTVHIQPYLHWDGVQFPHTIPCFMQPNDPLILTVLKKAGEYASQGGCSLHGYQGNSREDVKKQAEFIYRALQDMNIHYISAPASFEKYGQKIRIPHQVLHEDSRQGTCLDLAILYATCLEAASLNSIVLLIPGHAFSGVWLTEMHLNQPLVDPSQADPQFWQKALNDLLPVECTTFTDGRSIDFTTAAAVGRENMSQCSYLVDVEAGWDEGLVPVYTYTDQPICGEPAGQDFAYQEFSKEKKSKIDLLRDQAMDITTKSRLLNNGSNPLMIEFSLDTAAFMRRGMEQEELMQLLDEEGVLKKQKNKNALRELYSKSCAGLRETGKNSLFLAIDQLKWRPEGKEGFLNAVLYLCPAEIYRNGRGDFLIRIFPEETIFNPALKVLLDQVYHLDSNRLTDQPGEDYARQMEFLNYLIGKQKGWALKKNTACLALYSIPNEAIWNGLKDPTVLEHEIVKGILEGEMNWDNQVGDQKPVQDGVYVFESDSSQGELIEAAFQRKSQVAVGPAGNGKTQTVVNIMTEAVRRGESVLFVSEKAPAMEVVYEKLNQVMNGLFNLRILAGKDRTADVVRQMKKTISFMENPGSLEADADLSRDLEKYQECIRYLQQYYERMKDKENACGKSLMELIEMDQKYAGCTLKLKLDEKCASIPWDRAEDEMSTYALYMENCDLAQGKFAEYIRYDNLMGKEGQETLKAAEEENDCYEELWSAVSLLEKLLSAPGLPSEKKRLQMLVQAAGLLQECPVCGKSREEILRSDREPSDPYPQRILAELKRMAATKSGQLKEHRKKNVREMLYKLYPSVGVVEDIIERYEKNPAEAARTLEELHVRRDQEGNFHVEEPPVSAAAFADYLKRVDSKLGKEDSLRKAVLKAIDKVVTGEDSAVREQAQRVMTIYRTYNGLMKKALARIAREPQAFQETYPDLPQHVLIREWLDNRDNDSSRDRSDYDRCSAEMKEKGYAAVIRQIEEIRRKRTLTKEEVLDGFRKSWADYQINSLQEENSRGEKNFDYIMFKNRVETLSEKENAVREHLKKEVIRMQMERMPNIQEGVSNNQEFGMLQNLIRNKKSVIRTFFEKVPHMLPVVFPCMIMDPSAVAEYIPSDFPQFDLVLIDEGSQMPAYNALIPIARAKRCMIFGDEKQLQPMDEFKKRMEGDLDLSDGRESILTAAYITSMPRKYLRFHYRSESESLIAFSNVHFYNRDIMTFPNCDTKVKGVFYEFVEGQYDKKGTKANLQEALRVIEKIRELYGKLPTNTEQTLGVVTLNVHQRDLIQALLLQEVRSDSELGMRVDRLVSIVNLESCQGKEWDYVIISPGFGYDENGKFSMGFGALNQEYGVNRLNVMLTRARRNMYVITSIEPYMLSNAQGEGVRKFREFLQYAKGDVTLDTRARTKEKRRPGLIDSIATRLEEEGYEVHTGIGSSKLKVDLGIVSREHPDRYALGILVDHFTDSESSIHDKEVTYLKSLTAKGWHIYRLQSLNWYNDWRRELRQIKKEMEAGKSGR